MHERLYLRSLALAVAIAIPGVAPAAAADKPADAPLGFSAAPVGQSAGHFEIEAEAGATVRSALRLSNPGRASIRVVLRRQDAGTAATGGLQYANPSPRGTGRWLKLERETILLAPGTARTVGFVSRIPADAAAGDHFAGIVAYDQADLDRVERSDRAGGVRLNFVSRFAIAVRYRVPGAASAAVEVDDARVVTGPSGAAIVVDLDNTGRLLVPSTKGRLTVTRDGEPLMEHPVNLGAFAPDSGIAYTVPWTGTPTEGTYRVRGFLHPANAPAVLIDREVTFGRQQSKTLEQKAGQHAVRAGLPGWVWTAPALLVIAAAALLLRQRRRRFIPPAAATRTARAPGSPPPAPAPGLIDVNTADEDDLARLPRVGPAAARRLIAHREEFGRFTSLEELASVPGFDSERVALLADRAVAR